MTEVPEIARRGAMIGLLSMALLLSAGDSSAAGSAALPLVEAPAPDSSGAALADLRHESESTRLYWQRRQAFVASLLSDAAHALADSAAWFRFLLSSGALALEADELARVPYAYDPIQERLAREDVDRPPLLGVGNVINAGAGLMRGSKNRRAAVDWQRIPSEAEMRVMKVVWQEREATSSELYAQLDSLNLTFKDLHRVLENLVAEGWLDERQISPRHEFTIQGGLVIEMSRRNAKNREFVYRPLATRERVLAYLDAAAFVHHLQAAPRDSLLAAHLRRLMMIMAESEAGSH